MRSAIIFNGSSLTDTALNTYKKIEDAVKEQLPDQDIYWCYNRRVINRAKKRGIKRALLEPAELIQSLSSRDHKVTVQSLHLLVGHEFHELYLEVAKVNHAHLHFGMPLLSSEDDYQTFIELMAPVIEQQERSATIFVGHGTRHPGWAAYLALENLLQRRFGSRVYCGVVEHSPTDSYLLENLKHQKIEKVMLLPLFLVAGVHYQRDVLSTSADSFKSKLEAMGIEVEYYPDGVGMMPGIENLIIDHIRQAKQL